MKMLKTMNKSGKARWVPMSTIELLHEYEGVVWVTARGREYRLEGGLTLEDAVARLEGMDAAPVEKLVRIGEGLYRPSVVAAVQDYDEHGYVLLHLSAGDYPGRAIAKEKISIEEARAALGWPEEDEE